MRKKPITPDELVERHLRLVSHIVRSFRKRLPTSVDFDDLLGPGNLALWDAARRFNPATGVPFTSFASRRISGAILDTLRHIDPVSRHIRSQHKEAERATGELATILGRAPTEAEIAKRLRLTIRGWRKLRRKLNEMGCPVNTAPTIVLDPDRLAGTFPDPEQIAQIEETRSMLKSAIATLPARSQQVIRLYHFEDRDVKEIAALLGVHPTRVSQIKTAALAQLQIELAPKFGQASA